MSASCEWVVGPPLENGTASVGSCLRAARPDIAELGRSIRQVGNVLAETAPAEVRADCLTDWREVERLIAELFAWRQPIPDIMPPVVRRGDDGTLVPFACPVTPEIGPGSTG